jgi:hypothetical protein
VSEISSQEFPKTIEKSSTKNENKNNNSSKKKKNVIIVIFINILKTLIIFNSILTLQEAISFKDGNFTIHSFLNTTLIYKYRGDFYNTVPITRIEDNNIKFHSKKIKLLLN